VTIRVKAMNDGNNQLLQWMLAPNDPRDFTVTYYNTVDGSTMKELKGTACYCVNYKESGKTARSTSRRSRWCARS
jgi:hypothetical protein